MIIRFCPALRFSSRHSGESRNPVPLIFVATSSAASPHGGVSACSFALDSAAGCRLNGAPRGAASRRRKSRQGGAQEARQFAARTWKCPQRTPQPGRAPAGQDARRARHLGCVSLVTFFAQAKKVTRSSAGGAEALFASKNRTTKEQDGISARAGMTSLRRRPEQGAGSRPTPG